jgi:hypothetical protein
MPSIHRIGPQTHVLGYFGSFRYCRNLGAKLGRTGAISKLDRATKSRLIFPQWMYLIHPIGPQTNVLERFGRFLYYTNFGANRAKLVINAQVRAMRSRRNFSQQTYPIHPIGPQTHVLGALGYFRYCTNFGAKRGGLVHRNFLQRTHPIHTIGPQTHVLVCFELFLYCRNFVAKWAKPVLLVHKFVQWCRVKFFSNEPTRYTPLDPRLMFWGVSDHSVIARTSVQNGPNWCH